MIDIEVPKEKGKRKRKKKRNTSVVLTMSTYLLDNRDKFTYIDLYIKNLLFRSIIISLFL